MFPKKVKSGKFVLNSDPQFFCPELWLGILSLEAKQCYVVCQDVPYYRAGQEAKNYQEQFSTKGVFPIAPF
jgi:hypothetical protein